MTAPLPSALNTTSGLHCWDPRLKILGLLLLAFTFSYITHMRLLPVMIGLTLTVVGISGYPVRKLLRRLRYPSLIIVCLVVLLPVSSGSTPLLQLGRLTLTTEGIEAAALVATRFFCILTLATVFLDTTPLIGNIRAIQALGMPYIMADMALLVVRYLNVLGNDLHCMRRSMKLRGHAEKTFSWKSLKTMAWLTANLLLRSHERSLGVYRAMRARGYGHTGPGFAGFKVKRSDVLGLITTGVVASVLVWLEISL